MKSLKNYIVGSLICLIFLFIGGIFVLFSSNSVVAQQRVATVEAIMPNGSGTEENPYEISSGSNLKFIAENIANDNYATGNYILTSSVEIDFCKPIGTAKNPFKGVFDGNGKTISVKHTEISENTKLGLFAYVNGATIKNLGVNYEAVLKSEETANQKIVVGGVAANARESTISECYCNFALKATKVEALSETEIKDFYVEKEDGNFETFKYNGEIIAGGLVGEGSSVKILNSYSFPEIVIDQLGSDESIFGGIAGVLSNGEIRNVYVAPTTKLATAIATKNELLTAIEAKDCQFVLFSSNPNSKTTFGGIVGYGSGGSLVVSNTLFGGMISSSGNLTAGNLTAGGIIGKIPENQTLWPRLIEFGKYVGFANPAINVVGLSNAVGNYSKVSGFNIPTSVSKISALPKHVEFTSWAWNEFNSWDFENVWKTTSTVTQTKGFFPMLQKFSSFKVQVSTSKAVSFDRNNKYLSGYLTFKINGEEENIVEVASGAKVIITATFYSDNENDHHIFKNYFMLTNWFFDEKPIQNSSVYEVKLDETNGEATLTFNATSKTEGIYDIGVKGKPVDVNVSLKNSDEQGQTENIGSVSKTQANQVSEKKENFSFEIAEYMSGESVTLKALGTEIGDFIFEKWEDGTNNFETSKGEIIIELNNEKKSSSARFYPEVIFDGEKLVANLNAYFSNNTSVVEFKIEGKGEITANEVSFETGDSESFVNSKMISLTATPGEDYEFEGWFVGDEKISSEINHAFLVSEDVEITAKFKAIEKKGGFVMPIWLIIVIVAVPLVLAGLITLIVVKAKKKNKGGYRKHYKF